MSTDRHDDWVARYNAGATTEEIALEDGTCLSVVGKALRAHPDYRPRRPGGPHAPAHKPKPKQHYLEPAASVVRPSVRRYMG